MAKVLVWGAQGQAKVLRPMIESGGHEISVVVDRDPSIESPFPGTPLVSPDEAEDWADRVDAFVVAVAGVSRGRDRVDLADRLTALGLEPLTLRHQAAWVAESAAVHAGAQICGLAGVSEEAVIGRQAILNTAATVDHECRLGAGVHIMPGATLAGLVTVEDYASVGSNATVHPRVSIGEGAVVGAGAIVTRDVPAGSLVVGPQSSVVGTEGDVDL